MAHEKVVVYKSGLLVCPSDLAFPLMHFVRYLGTAVKLTLNSPPNIVSLNRGFWTLLKYSFK